MSAHNQRKPVPTYHSYACSCGATSPEDRVLSKATSKALREGWYLAPAAVRCPACRRARIDAADKAASSSEHGAAGVR